jgi:AcrR family transcriptional regulator
MPVKDCQTEKIILDTAAKVFFVEGRKHATTQEIADAAGVNRTLINYYFRSKNALFTALLQNFHKEFSESANAILSSNMPFREKTEKYMDDFLNRAMKYPYLEPFITLDIIQERFINKNDSGFQDEQPAAIKQYLKEIENEMKTGKIPTGNPVHFMLNLLSLIIYPFITKPLQMKILNLNEEEYRIIMNERREIVLQTLFPYQNNE